MQNELASAMTSAEAAEALSVSVKTITRWVASGKLKPALRLPGARGAYIFASSDVEALLAQGESWEPSR